MEAPWCLKVPAAPLRRLVRPLWHQFCRWLRGPALLQPAARRQDLLPLPPPRHGGPAVGLAGAVAMANQNDARTLPVKYEASGVQYRGFRDACILSQEA